MPRTDPHERHAVAMVRIHVRLHFEDEACDLVVPGLDRALNHVGLMPLFDATRCADESFSKPHPAMLHELMADLVVRPQETLMIGDTTHDLDMAANAAVASLAVTYGAHPTEQLRARAPLEVLDSVPALTEWLYANA